MAKEIKNITKEVAENFLKEPNSWDLSKATHLDEDAAEVKKIEGPKFDPQSIKDYLDEHVIGQDDAKIVLSVAIANPYVLAKILR